MGDYSQLSTLRVSLRDIGCHFWQSGRSWNVKGPLSSCSRIQRADFMDLICRSRRTAEPREGWASDHRITHGPLARVYLNEDSAD